MDRGREGKGGSGRKKGSAINGHQNTQCDFELFFLRNEFYDFLTKQFCGENLQFYETVQAWKAMTLGDEKKRVNAQLIYENVFPDHFFSLLAKIN